MSTRGVALRHALAFRCSGGDCPETCCTGWKVYVDEGHYRKLRRALGDEALGRAARPVPPDQRRPERYALLVLDERDRCGQLDERGLCRIQSRHGPGLLPDTCAVYPRVLSRVGDRYELQLMLSCPEAARGALLADDAMDLVPAPLSHFPADRKAVIRTLAPDDDDPWAARLDDVRGLAYELLGARAWPLATRVAFTLAFADRVQGFFAPGSAAGSDALFDQAVAASSDEAMRVALHRRLLAPARPDELRIAPHLVLELIAARLAVPGPASFLRVAQAALAGCEVPGGKRLVSIAGGAASPPSELRSSPEQVLAVHTARRAGLPEALVERADRCFENYARAYWMRHWHLHAPSLVAHAQGLALRLAALRFLVLGHPGTVRARALLEAPAGGEEAAATTEALRHFDQAIVECTWGYSRATEHLTEFYEGVARILEEAGLHTLRHGLALLRF